MGNEKLEKIIVDTLISSRDAPVHSLVIEVWKSDAVIIAKAIYDAGYREVEDRIYTNAKTGEQFRQIRIEVK